MAPKEFVVGAWPTSLNIAPSQPAASSTWIVPNPTHMAVSGADVKYIMVPCLREEAHWQGLIETYINTFNTVTDYAPNSTPSDATIRRQKQMSYSYQFIFKNVTGPIAAPYVEGRCVCIEANETDWNTILNALFNGAETSVGLDWENPTEIALVAAYTGAFTKAVERKCFQLNPQYVSDLRLWIPEEIEQLE